MVCETCRVDRQINQHPGAFRRVCICVPGLRADLRTEAEPAFPRRKTAQPQQVRAESSTPCRVWNHWLPLGWQAILSNLSTLLGGFSGQQTACTSRPTEQPLRMKNWKL